ncbi:MAG: hypothetical protein ABH951_02440 [Patescibacteria group bacterium]
MANKPKSVPKSLWVLPIIFVVSLLVTAIILVVTQKPSQSGNQNNNEDYWYDSTNVYSYPIEQGMKKTTYSFSDFPDGKVIIPITDTTTFYPRGGKVTFETPSGESYTLTPGDTTEFSVANGNSTYYGDYIFQAGDSLATGVDIWQ